MTTSAAQIRGDLDAANALNGLILMAVQATGVNLVGTDVAEQLVGS